MDCDEEREGYVNPLRPAYPVIHTPATSQKEPHHVSYRGEESVGLVITIGGASWAVYSAIFERASLWQLQFMPPTPVEVCALGILIWLHAKWRHASKTS